MTDYFVNIGNTHTSFATWKDSKFVRVLVQLTRTAFFELPPCDADTRFWIASVVPSVKHHFDGLNAVFLTVKNMPPIPKMPACVGADRLANLLALAVRYKRNAFVLDIGTCITLEGLDENGAVAGGAILPGRRLAHRVVRDHAALLDDTPLAMTMPDQLAFNTVTALQLGIDRGLLGTLKELIAMVRKPGTRIILTGGDAPFFAPFLPDTEYIPDLTFEGIRIFKESDGVHG